MKTLALLILAALTATCLADVSTTDLVHRWRFTETAAPYVDEIGGEALTVGGGTVVSVAGETAGAMTGVMLNSAAGTDSSAWLAGGTTFLSGRQNWTLEVVFRCVPGNSVAAGYVNLFSISNAPYATTPRGMQLARYATSGTSLRYYGLAGNNSQGTKVMDASSQAAATLAESGALQHFCLVADTTLGLKAYHAPLATSPLGTKDDFDATVMNAMTDTLITIGDTTNFVGQMHIMEIRLYGAALDSTTLAGNHAADRTAYLDTGDVWVDANAATAGYGTQTQPFQSLRTASTRISDGWTLHVLDGTHNGIFSTTSTAKPSASTEIVVQGQSAAGTILLGTAATEYPFGVATGSWTLRDLTLDADSTAGYGAYAAAAAVDTLRLTNCIVTRANDSGSDGTGVMSRAKVTLLDGCTIEHNEEHGVYLRNYQAAADYAGNQITDCTISDFVNYGIQTSNESDTTYQFTGAIISGNTITGGAGTVGGGMILYGLDGGYIRNNAIDMTLATGTEVGVAFSAGSGTYVGGRNVLLNNNRIAGAATGVYGGGTTDTYAALNDSIYNNFLVNCVTEFDAGTMVGYHLTNNCGVGGTTPFPDSTGTFADSLSWRMDWGGKPVTGITANSWGLYPVGVQDNTRVSDLMYDNPMIGYTIGWETLRNAIDNIRSIPTYGISMQYRVSCASDFSNYQDWISNYSTLPSMDDTLKVKAVP